MRSIPRALLALAVPLAVAAATVGTARGQGPDNKVAAEALFEEGRRLLADGKYADACPKFADSQKLDPSPSTLLNLANCWEKIGRAATAWATYKEAASAANAAGRKDYEATAERRADALAPKLSRATVQVTQPVDGMEIKRDGGAVSRAEWGVAIPIDPGHHEFAATAPGYKSWSTGIDVGLDPSQVTVTVPTLQAGPSEASASSASTSPSALVAPSAGASGTVVVAPTATAEPSLGSSQRLIGIIVGGVGIASLGASAILVSMAKGKYNTSLGNCEPNNADLCNPQGLQQRSDARTLGDAATVTFSVGVAALVGGALLWLTAPSAAPSPAGSAAASLRIEPTLGGVAVHGAW